MIRLATISDTQACFDMAREIYGDFMLVHGIEIVNNDLWRTVEFFINSNQALVVERDNQIVGMTAWILVPHPANASCKIFQEVLWCCNSQSKTDALFLLRAIEAKANELGADIIVLANLNLDNESRLRRIYERMGYAFMESHFARVN